MKAIDELRGMRGNNATYEDVVVRCCELADEIERELEERYVERPVDADGMTIAPSDNMIDSNGEQFVVSSIELLASGEWLVYGNGKLGNEFAKFCHHYKPPTVEDVLREMLVQAVGYSDANTTVALNAIAKFAERLQLREAD